MEKKRVFRTKKKVAGGSKMYKPWKEFHEGDWVIGEYIGTHKDQYDKICRIIKVEDAQFADGFQEKCIGKNLVLNSVGMMDKAWEEDDAGDLEIGAIIQVTYNGTSTIEKGKFAGKDAHLVEIDLVEEDVDEYEDEESEEEEFEDDL